MAEERTQDQRTTKPSGATGHTSKGATVTGANETEEGIIQQLPIEPPGPDQIGLVGGDPGVPQHSQTGNPNWKEEVVDAAEAKRHARPENRDNKENKK